MTDDRLITNCPNCQTRVAYRPEHQGRAATCPKCDCKFPLPDAPKIVITLPEPPPPPLPPPAPYQPQHQFAPQPVFAPQPQYSPYPQYPQTVVVQHTYPQRRGKSRLAYILLAVFLGGLGIHNFYAGYAVNGIVQLLLSLGGIFLCFIPNVIVFIWNIVDICVVTYDSDGIPFE